MGVFNRYQGRKISDRNLLNKLNEVEATTTRITAPSGTSQIDLLSRVVWVNQVYTNNEYPYFESIKKALDDVNVEDGHTIIVTDNGEGSLPESINVTKQVHFIMWNCDITTNTFNLNNKITITGNGKIQALNFESGSNGSIVNGEFTINDRLSVDDNVTDITVITSKDFIPSTLFEVRDNAELYLKCKSIDLSTITSPGNRRLFTSSSLYLQCDKIETQTTSSLNLLANSSLTAIVNESIGYIEKTEDNCRLDISILHTSNNVSSANIFELKDIGNTNIINISGGNLKITNAGSGFTTGSSFAIDNALNVEVSNLRNSPSFYCDCIDFTTSGSTDIGYNDNVTIIATDDIHVDGNIQHNTGKVILQSNTLLVDQNVNDNEIINFNTKGNATITGFVAFNTKEEFNCDGLLTFSNYVRVNSGSINCNKVNFEDNLQNCANLVVNSNDTVTISNDIATNTNVTINSNKDIIVNGSIATITMLRLNAVGNITTNLIQIVTDLLMNANDITVLGAFNNNVTSNINCNKFNTKLGVNTNTLVNINANEIEFSTTATPGNISGNTMYLNASKQFTCERRIENGTYNIFGGCDVNITGDIDLSTFLTLNIHDVNDVITTGLFNPSESYISGKSITISGSSGITNYTNDNIFKALDNVTIGANIISGSGLLNIEAQESISLTGLITDNSNLILKSKNINLNNNIHNNTNLVIEGENISINSTTGSFVNNPGVKLYGSNIIIGNTFNSSSLVNIDAKDMLTFDNYISGSSGKIRASSLQFGTASIIDNCTLDIDVTRDCTNLEIIESNVNANVYSLGSVYASSSIANIKTDILSLSGSFENCNGSFNFNKNTSLNTVVFSSLSSSMDLECNLRTIANPNSGSDIYPFYANGSDINIYNSTFKNNTAFMAGFGLWALANGSNIRVNGTVVVDVFAPVAAENIAGANSVIVYNGRLSSNTLMSSGINIDEFVTTNKTQDINVTLNM